MEREPSPMYNGSSAVRSTRAPPVLQVNVLYGLTGDDMVGGGAGPLGNSSGIVNASAINLSRTQTSVAGGTAGNSNGVASTFSTTRRITSDGVSANNGAFSLTASNGSGTATSSSSLAKPVLDPAQVRCCPLDQWVPDAHVVNCMAPDCTNNFSLFNRKHRCRMCGRVFCASCCNNLVYISAAIAAKTMPGGMTETAMAANAYGAGTNSSAITPEPAGAVHNGTGAYGGGSTNNNGSAAAQRSTGEDSSAGSATPGVLTPTTIATNTNPDGSMPASPAINATATNVASMISSPVTANAVPCRVCASCSYEVQLVVSTRQENGELRRRSRGELKMLQRVLLVNVMTYLNLLDLASVALVSADFYFMSRDNLIWYQYNMTRWVQEGEAMQLSSLKSRAEAMRAQQQRSSTWYGGGGSAPSSLADDIFKSTPAIQDATALSESEAAKRVISLHARYNYTQFLDFARRQEMARCEGLSSFSLGARILLSSPIRVALVGPCGIGKTAAVKSFLGEKATQMVVRPTIGFQRRAISVRLAGGLSTEVTLHLYDLSGADRYEELRRFVCRHCHAIALCYDPNQKVTLVQAADIMMELEPALGPQPVVVCGLLRKSAHATTSAGGSALTASRSTGAFEGGSNPRQALSLEEHHNATSLPISSSAADRTDSPVTSPPSPALSKASRSGADDVAGSSPRPGKTADDSGSACAPSLPRANTFVATSGSAAASMPASAIHRGVAAATEVSVEDAVGITVRGQSSIQCPMMHPAPLFEAVVQAVLDRLAEATVASTTSISDISAELTMQGGDGSPPGSMTGRMLSAINRSVPSSAIRASVRRRRPAVSRTIVQDLLNLTMQPCALDILLDRK